MTIQDAIAKYMENFDQCWEEEKYKWVAVKHYKQHWDINAKDFPTMLEKSFGAASNLLSGAMYYPYTVVDIIHSWIRRSAG